jgi:hypothetical protein
MRPGALRRLTLGERGLAAECFGTLLDPDTVRLWAFPAGLDRAFVAGRAFGRVWMAYPARQALSDFAAAAVPLRVQAVFVHELTHVQQAQAGVNLLFAKLRCGDGPDSYSYKLDGACDWRGFNIEQQAMLVEHGFLARHGAATPYERAAYEAVSPFGSRTTQA